MTCTVTLTRRAKLTRLPDDWGAAQDNALRDTKGKYARIAKLSDKCGVSETVLMARWHKLRQGAMRHAPPVAPRQAASFAPVKRFAVRPSLDGVTAGLSPTHRQILNALRRAGPAGLTYPQLMERTGAARQTVYDGVKKIEAAVAPTAWVLVSENMPKMGAPKRLRLTKPMRGAT